MGPPPRAASGEGRFLDDDLPHLLARAAQAVAETFHTALRRQGITFPVWRVLAVLSDCPSGGETVSGLAAACLLQQPTTTKLLDRLERGGLVQRRPDERDGRIVRVGLTPAGQTRAAALVAAARQHEAAVLARHPEAEGMKAVLRALIAQPGSRPAAEPEPGSRHSAEP